MQFRHFQMRHTFRILNDFKLLFPAQVITNVVVFDNGLLLDCVVTCGSSQRQRCRLLNKNGNGHRRSRSTAKNLAAFLSRKFPARALISSQVEHINLAEFLFQALAEAIHGIAINPTSIGNKTDYAPILGVNTVCCPAESLDIAIIQGVLICRSTSLSIRFIHASIQIRILLVLRIVICTFLPHRIGRVTHHHLNRHSLLRSCARSIHRENIFATIRLFRLFTQLEAIR